MKHSHFLSVLSAWPSILPMFRWSCDRCKPTNISVPCYYSGTMPTKKELQTLYYPPLSVIIVFTAPQRNRVISSGSNYTGLYPIMDDSSSGSWWEYRPNNKVKVKREWTSLLQRCGKVLFPVSPIAASITHRSLVCKPPFTYFLRPCPELFYYDGNDDDDDYCVDDCSVVGSFVGGGGIWRVGGDDIDDDDDDNDVCQYYPLMPRGESDGSWRAGGWLFQIRLSLA